MKTQPLLLIGGGGHCASCIDVIEQEGRFTIVGIIDVEEKRGKTFLGHPYIGTDQDIPEMIKKYENAFVTLGQIKSAQKRKELIQRIIQLGGNIPSLISPRSYISQHARLGQGSIVMHDVIVNANTEIGDFAILNSKSLIEHDCRVGKYCHISTGAVLNGHVIIEDECFIGSQSVVVESVHIPKNVILGAGLTLRKTPNAGEVIKCTT